LKLDYLVGNLKLTLENHHLFSFIFVFLAPGRIGAGRIMAGAAPIPFTRIAEYDFHAQ
jgi:hypothetical protein